MKKLIYTIGVIMFLSGPLYPWAGTAAEPAAGDIACQGMTLPQLCQLTSRVKYALRGKGNEGLDFGASFGQTDPTKVGQDLYLTVYNKTVTSPFEGAIKATAAQYGLPPERMSLILGGDITPILERNPLLRIDDAIKIYNQMIATFNDKKNSLDISSKIAAKVEMNEMFADGDTDNSGFDLVNDLANIEIILFKKNDPVTFGQSYTPDSGDGSSTNSNGSNSNNTNSKDLPIDVSGPSDGSTEAKNDQSNKPPVVKNPFQKIDVLDPVFLGGINPNQCFAQKDLESALDKFADAASKDPKLKSTAKEEGKNKEKPENANTGGSDGLWPDLSVPTAKTNAPAVPAAPPADYDQPTICDEIVCISLDFVKTPAKPSFSQSDNCILCHLQYINDGLRKTISHSLIPGKASGNLGESGLCKTAAGTALGSVGMNVSLKIVPVITPAKDDLITLGNIGDEWDKYAKDNGFWNYSEKKRQTLQSKSSGKPEYTPSISALERQLIVEISNGADGATQKDALAKAEKTYGQAVAGEKQALLVAEISKEAFGQASTLQALTDEMKQMNGFFLGFQKQFRTLLEDVPGVPGTKACVKLNQKKQCS